MASRTNLRTRTDREEAERAALKSLAAEHGMELVHAHHRKVDTRAVFLLEARRAMEVVNAINGVGFSGGIRVKAATSAHRQVFTKELVAGAASHFNAPEVRTPTALVEWMKANRPEHALVTVKAVRIGRRSAPGY